MEINCNRIIIIKTIVGFMIKNNNKMQSVILLPAHPASFAHKFLYQGVLGCNSMADLSLKIVIWTH